MKRISISRGLIAFAVLIYAVICLIPFLMVIGASFQDESEIRTEGYKIIPAKFSIQAYRLLFSRSDLLVSSYTTSIMVTVIGTILALLVCSMLAYALSIRELKLSRALAFYVIITMLFNGGMVPWYIVCVKYLHLKDSLWAMILPLVCNAFNVFLLRNYFSSLPPALRESARIDGAGEFRTFIQIILPLSKPVLASVGMLICLSYWNDWWNALMLVDKTEIQPIQLMLRTIISNVQFLRSNPQGAAMLSSMPVVPSEGVKLATCVVTVGPIIFVYPFVQKYFVKGIMLGAVKG